MIARLALLCLLHAFCVSSIAADAGAEPVRPAPVVVSATVDYEAPPEDAVASSVPGNPKNVILFIGDGMGPAHVAAGRAATVGPAGITHMDLMPVTGFVKTHSANDPVTDSAAGGTAIASGKKTLNGAVGVTPDEQPVETMRDWAEAAGKSTGIVTTERITGATPASFFAHASKRSLTADIAAQVPGSDVDIFIGGGMGALSEARDGVIPRTEAEKNGFVVVDTLDALKQAAAGEARVLALLAKDALPPAAERDFALIDLVKAALTKLSADPEGFFLMVEGAQIDWAAHDNLAQQLVDEWADLDMAVGEAIKFSEARKDTLVLVTADHETGGVTLPSAPGVTLSGAGEAEGKPSIGIAFSTGSHTSIMVPLFASGVGAPSFAGVRDNTQIAPVIKELWNAHE